MPLTRLFNVDKQEESREHIKLKTWFSSYRNLSSFLRQLHDNKPFALQQMHLTCYLSTRTSLVDDYDVGDWSLSETRIQIQP